MITCFAENVFVDKITLESGSFRRGFDINGNQFLALCVNNNTIERLRGFEIKSFKFIGTPLHQNEINLYANIRKELSKRAR